MDKQTQTKERILWACNLINNSRSGTIQILRDSTIANVRSIERNSRSLKDPNPLMSTMTNINVKFPITFRTNRINTELVPPEYISKTLDNRRSGRTLCKTDMIQWYIDNISENDSKEKSIIKLFEASAKKYDKVFNYNWEEVKFKIGNVSLSRSLVPVNPNEIDIPKEFIKPAILQTLNLDNMVEYVDVPDYYLDQVKNIIQNSNLDIRSLPNVLNYIVSQMDKRYRYLPILKGLSPDFIYISHALLQPQYRASVLMSEASTIKGQNKSITELCINLIYYCRMNKIPYYQLKEMVHAFTFFGYPVAKILNSTDENKYTKFVRGCLGVEIMPTIEKASIKYYPKQSKLFETTHTNKSGLDFKRYNGEEIVFFESSNSKGFFIHNADALLTITINRTSIKNLAFVLGNIAVFITKGFDFCKAPTIKSMRGLIQRQYTEKWWLVVGMDERVQRNIKREIEHGEGDVTMGALRFSDSVEIEYPEREKCIVKDDVLIGERTGQPICIAPFVAETVMLDFNIKANNPKFYTILHPKRQLIKAIQYNLEFLGKIKTNIKLNQFSSPFYNQLIKYVPFSLQEKVSEYIKGMLASKVVMGCQNDLLIATFYSFAYGGEKRSSLMELESFIFAKERLYFSLSNGIIRTSENGDLNCDNEVIVSVSNNVRDENEAVCALMPNFTLKRVFQFKRGIPTHSIAWLNKNCEKMKEGELAYTIFQTAIFEVKKSSSVKIQTLNTLKRHIVIGVEQDTSNEFTRYLLKRKLDDSSGSSGGHSGEKRKKIDDASSVIS